MPQPDPIKSQALEFLHWAPPVRDMLVDRMRSNELVEKAYLYKYRVKDLESLCNKIRKKNGNGGDTINLDDITDIVGIRLLSLFKEELPILVKELLEFISRNIDMFHHTGKGPHKKPSLLDVVEEAIVYLPSRGEIDSAYSLAITEFTERGFEKNDVTDQTEQESADSASKKRGYVRVDRKKNNEYSSIHIIARVAHRGPGDLPAIPIEFQLRTAFEELWAEVDHKVIYKGPMDKFEHDERKRSFKRISKRLSGTIKLHLDACSDSCDDLKTLVKGLAEYFSDEDLTRAKNYNIRFFEAELDKTPVANGKLAIEKIRAFFRMKDSSREERHKAVMEAIKILEPLEESARATENSRLIHFYWMEMALLYVNRALLERG
jgi:ppGpp synthetase/RelA/SpoT-type nucleotidyltranferase